jgi:anti-repressor protein
MEELVRVTTREDGLVELTHKFDFSGTEITLFRNNENDVLFVAADLCALLDIKNVTDALNSLDEDEKLTSVIPRSGQKRQMNIITESGMYSLVLRSNKPEAKAFKKWVTSEVLPQIRKSGSYSPQRSLPKDFVAALRDLANETEARINAEQQLEASVEIIHDMVPKVEFYDKVTNSTDCLDMGDVAKVANLGMGRNQLFKRLRDDKVLMLDNVPYEQFVKRGYFRVIETPYDLPDGKTKIKTKTIVSQKGLEWIIKRYGQEDDPEPLSNSHLEHFTDAHNPHLQ